MNQLVKGLLLFLRLDPRYSTRHLHLLSTPLSDHCKCCKIAIRSDSVNSLRPTINATKKIRECQQINELPSILIINSTTDSHTLLSLVDRISVPRIAVPHKNRMESMRTVTKTILCQVYSLNEYTNEIALMKDKTIVSLLSEAIFPFL